jgi:protein gp37
MVFVNSMSDLFHDQVPDEFIARVFAVMAIARRHTFQVLTKRHGRMRSLLSSPSFGHLVAEQGRAHHVGCQQDWLAVGAMLGGRPLPNVWLGVSAEDQKRADIRIPALLATPAAVRFVSAEPLLGPIDLKQAVIPMGDQRGHGLTASFVHAGSCCDRFHGIDWVIAGGESGPRARPMHPDWPRQLRDQCAAAGVAFFFKQWGGRTPNAGGRLLDGRTWDELPREAGDRRAQAA